MNAFLYENLAICKSRSHVYNIQGMETAIVGLGNWGKVLLGEFAKQTRVKACCTTGSWTNRQWLSANHPAISHVTDYDQILNDPLIEGLVIATPISTHLDIARRALEHDKHVFLEKPPTVTENDLLELGDLAKSRKRTLIVDHIFKYHPCFTEMLGVIGTRHITSIDSRWIKWGLFKENIYWNLMYHDIYLMHELGVKVNDGEVLSTRGNITDIDATHVSLMLDSGSKASIYIERLAAVKNKSFSVQTDDGTWIWNDNDLFRVDDRNQKLELVYTATTQPLSYMVSDFVNQVEGQRYGNVSSFSLDTVRCIQRLTGKTN